MFSRAVTEGINHHSQLICAGLSHSLFGWISANQAETDAASNAAARPVYPFSAIIGQEEMKFAAIMNIIDPKIGGIMVMGDRGTGKSTTVRSLVCFDWMNPIWALYFSSSTGWPTAANWRCQRWPFHEQPNWPQLDVSRYTQIISWRVCYYVKTIPVPLFHLHQLYIWL